MKHVISIDWLEVFGYLTTETPCDAYFENLMFSCKYKFEKQDYSGRVYAQKYKVYDGADNYIYDLYCEPRSSVLKKNACTVRCSNSECYNHYVFDDLRVFCSDIGFVFNNISRLDICHDSNCFAGGISGDTLIRRFMSGKIRLSRRLKFTVMGDNCGSDMYSGIKIDTQKKITKKNTDISTDYRLQGVRWGSRKSAVGVKIYNKTQEMLDVKVKQHIINCWHDNGLNLDRPVWRTEISLNRDSMQWLSRETGEIFDLNVETERLTSRLNDTFFSICAKYLCFHNLIDSETRVDRMPVYDIFSDWGQKKERITRYREPHTENSSKMNKYITKRLVEESNDSLRYNGEERRIINKVAILLAKKYNLIKKEYKGALTFADLRCFCATNLETEQELVAKLNRWTCEIAKQKELLFSKQYPIEIDASWNVPLIAISPSSYTISPHYFSKTKQKLDEYRYPF